MRRGVSWGCSKPPLSHALAPRRHTGPSHPAGCRNQTRPCSLVFQNGERNRITPAVRLRGHSARLPSGLLALVSPPPYQARWHPCLETLTTDIRPGPDRRERAIVLSLIWKCPTFVVP